jgi:dolichol-phosphate mannosyltransferase
MSRALVVIPTYNESGNLPALVPRVLALQPPVEILIVDDNSPDGTGVLADQLAREHPTVHVLHRSKREGLGRAYCAGFAWALEREYDFICEMDGDHSHDPADLPRLIAAAQEADLVLGSRYVGGTIRVVNWPRRRLWLSTGAARYVRTITGMPFSDPTGGFKCFRRQAFRFVELKKIQSNGYSFQIELTHRIWSHGGQVAEIPITFTERTHGRSKMSLRIIVEAMSLVWRLRTHRPTDA